MRGVVYRPIHPKPPTIELSVAWRQDDTSSLVSAFVETCRATAAKVARVS
jgi:hypothetical protein